jgi:hypothetical protein
MCSRDREHVCIGICCSIVISAAWLAGMMLLSGVIVGLGNVRYNGYDANSSFWIVLGLAIGAAAALALCIIILVCMCQHCYCPERPSKAPPTEETGAPKESV